jgi:glycopeptide antibiotics resistance protein
MGGKLNLSLFSEYRLLIREDIPRFIYLFFGNIGWFIPLGIYCTACRKKTITAAVITGLLLSLCIETMQFVLGTGVSEADDLVLNTFGCFIGSLAGRRFGKQ